MKKIIILTFFILLQFFIILKSIMADSIDPFTIICYYIFILFTAYIFIKFYKKWIIVLMGTFLYCVLIFVFIFSSREAKYQLLVNQSNNAFLELPLKNIIRINILARPLRIKKYYKFAILNKELINNFLLSLKKCEELDDTGTHLWDYYAITFINDKNEMYSFEIQKNCEIPNNMRSPLCNRVYVKFEPHFSVFDYSGPNLEAVVFYKCDDIVPLLNKYIETLIEKNPEKIYQVIN